MRDRLPECENGSDGRGDGYGPAVASGAMVIAHETWFIQNAPGTDWDFAGQTATLVLLGFAVLATVLSGS